MLLLLLVFLAACGAEAVVVVPTARPTATPTATEAPTRTPARDVTPSPFPTQPPASPTGGPSPTPLFGQARADVTAGVATAALNPNAPRIEFFTTNVIAVVPGEPVTLFWSARGTTRASIYRVERGVRNQVWNVGPDGSLSVPTRRIDRGAVDFVLSVGDGDARVEQTLSVPLVCPDLWFFQPPPQACPSGAAQETSLIEQAFERGRMVYVQTANTLFALFNDRSSPAWSSFQNRYNPAVDPESEPSFVPPPNFYQPVRTLGFLWRGNDTVRNRLGLGIQPEFVYTGFVQSSTDADGAVTLYISSGDGAVLQLLPEGAVWQIVASGR